MGENGAGKSTLMKILTGIYQADHGQILIENTQQTIKTPVDAQKIGIAMIHQELHLLPEMSVAENFFSDAKSCVTVFYKTTDARDRRAKIE